MCLRTSEVPHGMPRVHRRCHPTGEGTGLLWGVDFGMEKRTEPSMPHILDDVHLRSFVPSCLSLSGFSFPITSWVYLHAHDETLFWVIRDRISRQAPQETHGGFRMHAQAHTPFPGVILRDPAPGMKQVLRSQLFLTALAQPDLPSPCL